MDTKTLKVGQKIWLQSGDLRKEATVIEIAKSHMTVEFGEFVGDESMRPLYRERPLYFRINGKPGTIFDNNRQWGDPEYGPICTEFGPWELSEETLDTAPVTSAETYAETLTAHS